MTKGPIEIAVAVVESQGKYLIGRRPEGTPLAGLWEFPGGKVKPGETPAEAAARECREETGLAVAIGESYGEVVHEYPHALVRIHFFSAQPCGELSLSAGRFLWASADELARYDFPDANRTLIDRLSASRNRASHNRAGRNRGDMPASPASPTSRENPNLRH